MKIIGHRGAPALELENTLASFKKAMEVGAEAIELDVHATKDRQYVLVHDTNMERVSSSRKKISQLTYDDLQRIPLRDGSRVPLLYDVLKATGDLPVFVELKDAGHEEAVCKILDKFPGRQFYTGSFKHEVAIEMHRLRPEILSAVSTNVKPFASIRRAKREGCAGVVMYHVFLPFAYHAARRANLEILVFPVGTTWILRKLARFLPGIWRTAWAARLLERRNWNFWDSKLVQWWYRRHFPDVWVCTDHPERWTKTR